MRAFDLDSRDILSDVKHRDWREGFSSIDLYLRARSFLSRGLTIAIP